jgi:hypothetical protein
MKFLLIVLAILVVSGCGEPTGPAELPPQTFEVGDHVTTTIPGNKVSGVVDWCMHEQYWSPGWSYRVKYINELGNLKREWFPEYELKLVWRE